IKAYLNAIVTANAEILREVLKMSTSELTLEKVLEEVGLIAKWEARGKALGLAVGEARGLAAGEARGLERGGASKANEIARNMLESGFPAEQVAQLSGLSLEQVYSIAAN
ncbi:MAG: hypothetical protein FWD91_00985, partial [Treponema sp.]|nr:hypothetical protein [Treponema sp.]